MGWGVAAGTSPAEAGWCGVSATFTTDQVALAIEIPGVYDGTCVWLLKDGTLVNRFSSWPGFGRRAARVDEWIAEHGAAVRAGNADLLDEDWGRS